jgi:transcriptional regulator with XRE-family HTH domain
LAYRNIESGKSIPKADSLSSLAQALGVTERRFRVTGSGLVVVDRLLAAGGARSVAFRPIGGSSGAPDASARASYRLPVSGSPEPRSSRSGSF